MEPPVYYAPSQSLNNDIIRLDKKESHHVAVVMRQIMGEMVIVVDGLGNAFRGEIIKINRSSQVEIKIHSHVRNFGEPNIRLTLASGLSTGYKFDTVIEKGTELGVKRFVPLLTEKSKVKLDDSKRLKLKQTRYEKVAIAAMKQCRRSYRPEISLPLSFPEYMKEIDQESLNLIFNPSKNSKIFYDIKFNQNIKRINVIVGPESGFSNSEITLAADNSVIPVSLGKRILRTETAGPIICGLIMNLFGELR